MSSLSENNNAFDSYVPNLSPQSPSSDNKSDINLCKHTVKEMDVNEIWKKSNFTNRQTNHKRETAVDLDPTKMSWNFEDAVNSEEAKNGEDVEKEEANQDQEEIRPHHARRPMNAFLIFCKKHRPIVRNKYLGLENRGVTKILGDWWAQLDVDEKKPFTDLAKEYKDAFFSANPNFKWYKLPAPPLRSLPPRPNNVKQETSPSVSPTIQSAPAAEFNPGKLADESQLGTLFTSTLMKANSSYSSKQDKQNNMFNNNNQMENNNKEYLSPVSNKDDSILPPKPLKKRPCEALVDNKPITRNLFEGRDEEMTDVTMTSYEDDEEDVKNGFRDTRKSGRKCKGQLYAKFMANGSLIKNKRDKNPEPNNSNLNNTITRLAERISCKAEAKPERTRTVSELSETEDFNKTIPSFNLNKRIADLTSLSYDTYQQRKRESKKRKRVKNRIESKAKVEVVNKGKNLVGSKKRKNKQNITHLEKERFPIGNVYNDMSGLDTLAAIAASKAKMESDGKSDAS